MKLRMILGAMDADVMLTDSAGIRWDVGNLFDHVEDDCCDYVADEVGIWRLKDDGTRDSVPVYKFDR